MGDYLICLCLYGVPLLLVAIFDLTFFQLLPDVPGGRYRGNAYTRFYQYRYLRKKILKS